MIDELDDPWTPEDAERLAEMVEGDLSLSDLPVTEFPRAPHLHASRIAQLAGQHASKRRRRAG